MKRIVISDVKFSNRYKSISANLGYTAEEYIEELLDLYSIWKAQGYIEVYENNSERTYGLRGRCNGAKTMCRSCGFAIYCKW